MNITYLHITELYKLINPNNPKIHNLEAIEESIRRYGFWGAIVINDSPSNVNKVIGAGNGRTKALMSLYEKDVPVTNITDWQIPVIVSNLQNEELFNFVVDDNLVGIISGGLSQLNNAVLMDKLDGENLPIAVSQADYDFLRKVFENDFKKDKPEGEDKPDKSDKVKLKKVVITILEESLYDEILNEVWTTLERYVLDEKIKIK